MQLIKPQEAQTIWGGNDGTIKIILGTPPYNPIPDTEIPGTSTGPTNPPTIVIFG